MASRGLDPLASGKNKVLDNSYSIEPTRGTIKYLLRQENLMDQDASDMSHHFEAIFAMFLKLSYFLGIAPYYIKTVVRQNKHIVETSSSRFQMAQIAFFTICIGLILVTSLFRTLVESGRHLDEFCKHNRYGQQIICNNGNHKHLKILTLQTLYVLGNTIARNIRRISRVQFLVIALTLWQLCKSFSKSIRQRNDCQSVYQNREVLLILSAYEELKEISNLICDIISETLVTEIVEDVYFTLEVQLSIRSADWLGILVIFETWITAFLAYFIAANAEEHVRKNASMNL
ncbi:unnamed protein product [Orchesella dallaii]|uniref:Gustatory receptor n=1 Tax=Orchesella dallaii TaxID=48710 RepID=A0ABP1QUB2_9HEXA